MCPQPTASFIVLFHGEGNKQKLEKQILGWRLPAPLASPRDPPLRYVYQPGSNRPSVPLAGPPINSLHGASTAAVTPQVSWLQNEGPLSTPGGTGTGTGQGPGHHVAA